jgi:hypothetical protein
MKNHLKKVTLLIAAPLIMLSSCSDDETKNTATVELGSATITGRVTADVILNNGIKKDGLPGYTVSATINTQDLVTSPSGNYPSKTFTTITDANGNYTLNIDANIKPVSVTLSYSPDFYASQTTENNTNRRVRYFTASPAAGGAFTVSKGQTVTRDIDLPSYDATNLDVGLAKVTGEVFFRNDVCKSASATLDSTVSLAPANTVLIAQWNDGVTGQPRELEIKTDANGKFEFSVETNGVQRITIRGRKFTAVRKQSQGGNCTNVANYEYTLFPFDVFVAKNETFSFVSASKLPLTGEVITFE